jgi:hypothetical protein
VALSERDYIISKAYSALEKGLPSALRAPGALDSLKAGSYGHNRLAAHGAGRFGGTLKKIGEKDIKRGRGDEMLRSANKVMWAGRGHKYGAAHGVPGSYTNTAGVRPFQH